MKEIERRFYFEGTSIPDDFERSDILQGYFSFQAGNQTRVRIQKTEKDINCYLTLKSKTDKDDIRDEFEYSISLKEAVEIMEKCHLLVYKERWQKKNIVIDGFQRHFLYKYCYNKDKNNGKGWGDVGQPIVEVENNENIPDYCGQEITNRNITFEEAKKFTMKFKKDGIIKSFILNVLGGK